MLKFNANDFNSNQNPSNLNTSYVKVQSREKCDFS